MGLRARLATAKIGNPVRGMLRQKAAPADGGQRERDRAQAEAEELQRAVDEVSVVLPMHDLEELPPRPP
jgi:hypothetical protein